MERECGKERRLFSDGTNCFFDPVISGRRHSEGASDEAPVAGFQHGCINYHLWSTNGLLSCPLRPRSATLALWSSTAKPGHLLCVIAVAWTLNMTWKNTTSPPSPSDFSFPFLFYHLHSSSFSFLSHLLSLSPGSSPLLFSPVLYCTSALPICSSSPLPSYILISCHLLFSFPDYCSLIYSPSLLSCFSFHVSCLFASLSSHFFTPLFFSPSHQINFSPLLAHHLNTAYTFFLYLSSLIFPSLHPLILFLFNFLSFLVKCIALPVTTTHRKPIGAMCILQSTYITLPVVTEKKWCVYVSCLLYSVWHSQWVKSALKTAVITEQTRKKCN